MNNLGHLTRLRLGSVLFTRQNKYFNTINICKQYTMAATSDDHSLKGMDNFRKLSGLRLFRSGCPDEATDDDIKKLLYYDIPVIIDFCDQSEVLLKDTDHLVDSYFEINQIGGLYKHPKKSSRDSSRESSRSSVKLSEKSGISLKVSDKSTTSAKISEESNEDIEKLSEGEVILPEVSEKSGKETEELARESTTSADFPETFYGDPPRKHYFVPIVHCVEYKAAIVRRASFFDRVKIMYYYLYDKAYGTKRTANFVGGEYLNPMGIVGLYKDLVQHCGKQIIEALKLLCEPENAGALICCAFGKDRTGILVALVLHICGRSKEEICADYARTQEQIDASERMTHRAKTEFLASHLTDPSFPTAEYSTMSELIDFIVNKYGSMDQYLDSIQFNESCREKLRQNLKE